MPEKTLLKNEKQTNKQNKKKKKNRAKYPTNVYVTHKFVKRTNTPDLSNAFGISSAKTQAVPEMLQAVTFRQLQLSKSLYSREKT